MSEKRVFRLPPKYAFEDSLTTEEKLMLDYYKRAFDSTDIEITYDKELDVALFIYTPNENKGELV